MFMFGPTPRPPGLAGFAERLRALRCKTTAAAPRASTHCVHFNLTGRTASPVQSRRRCLKVVSVRPAVIAGFRGTSRFS